VQMTPGKQGAKIYSLIDPLPDLHPESHQSSATAAPELHLPEIAGAEPEQPAA